MFAEGYREEQDTPDDALMQAACDLARGKDAVLIYAGLPDRYESEGFDRESLAIPHNQTELIRRVSEVNPNIAVVLACGSVVDLDWEACAKSILLMHLAEKRSGVRWRIWSRAAFALEGSSRRAGLCVWKTLLAMHISPATHERWNTARASSSATAITIPRGKISVSVGRGLSYTSFLF